MNTIDGVLPHIQLKFAIEHVALEECYSQGYESAVQELPEGANPYKPDSREAEFWTEGWWAAFFGEEPLYLNSSSVEDAAIDVMPIVSAANDGHYKYDFKTFLTVESVEIGGAVAAAVLVGYQLLELVI